MGPDAPTTPLINTTTTITTNAASLINILYGLTALICFFIGTLGNILAFSYFLHKKKDIPTVVYSFITIIDVIVSILILPIGISYLSEREPVLFNSTIFCNICGFLWFVVQHTTIFLVAVLNVTRTFSIVAPFKKLRVKYVAGIISFYILTQIVQASVPYWFNVQYRYRYYPVECIWYAIQITEPGSVGYLIYTVSFLIQLCAPFCCIVISCIITIASFALTTHTYT